MITIADWGVPVIFKNSGRSLSRIQSSLDSLHGWWNTIETTDLDQDGDLDFIFGNQGSNIPYKPSLTNPMKLWINDFDNNGTIEQITTTNYDNGDYPIHMRKELTTQMASLKKENLMASDYAKKTVNQLFPNEVIENTIVKSVNIAETIVAVNEGEGKYSIIILPNRVQFSCVNSITSTDINKDGNIDLIMAGNNFEFKPQFSRLETRLRLARRHRQREQPARHWRCPKFKTPTYRTGRNYPTRTYRRNTP